MKRHQRPEICRGSDLPSICKLMEDQKCVEKFSNDTYKYYMKLDKKDGWEMNSKDETNDTETKIYEEIRKEHMRTIFERELRQLCTYF